MDYKENVFGRWVGTTNRIAYFSWDFYMDFKSFLQAVVALKLKSFWLFIAFNLQISRWDDGQAVIQYIVRFPTLEYYILYFNWILNTNCLLDLFISIHYNQAISDKEVFIYHDSMWLGTILKTENKFISSIRIAGKISTLEDLTIEAIIVL